MTRTAAVERVQGAFAVHVKRPDGTELTFHLDNVFDETREWPPEKRAQKIRTWLGEASAAGAVESWETAQERLSIVLRPATVLLEVKMQLVSQPAVPFLVEMVAVDSDTTIRYATAADMQSWRVGKTQLFDRARSNFGSYLKSLSGSDVEPYDPKASTPLWHVSRDDDYESSRLLAPEWLASFRGKAKGAPVAAVPARNQLLVTGDADDAAIERLLQYARREYEASPRRLSPALYTVDSQDQVVPYRVAKEHRLFNALRESEVVLATVEYKYQKAYLEQAAATKGEDVYVSQYTGREIHSGEIVSMSTWAENVMTLLPRTDVIAIGGRRPNGETWSLFVEWDRVAEVLGKDCLRLEPGLAPERYRTVRWPTAAELQELERVAIK